MTLLRALWHWSAWPCGLRNVGLPQRVEAGRTSRGGAAGSQHSPHSDETFPGTKFPRAPRIPRRADKVKCGALGSWVRAGCAAPVSSHVALGTYPRGGAGGPVARRPPGPARLDIFGGARHWPGPGRPAPAANASSAVQPSHRIPARGGQQRDASPEADLAGVGWQATGRRLGAAAVREAPARVDGGAPSGARERRAEETACNGKTTAAGEAGEQRRGRGGRAAATTGPPDPDGPPLAARSARDPCAATLDLAAKRPYRARALPSGGDRNGLARANGGARGPRSLAPIGLGAPPCGPRPAAVRSHTTAHAHSSTPSNASRRAVAVAVSWTTAEAPPSPGPFCCFVAAGRAVKHVPRVTPTAPRLHVPGLIIKQPACWAAGDAPPHLGRAGAKLGVVGGETTPAARPVHRRPDGQGKVASGGRRSSASYTPTHVSIYARSMRPLTFGLLHLRMAAAPASMRSPRPGPGLRRHCAAEPAPTRTPSVILPLAGPARPRPPWRALVLWVSSPATIAYQARGPFAHVAASEAPAPHSSRRPWPEIVKRLRDGLPFTSIAHMPR
ncbi:hypothetical protein BDY21DRAFT_400959 [Lineolata rhizophorae]|uniref:Uncharacterized protein n=1 Tax=Lineolata rhizophorae TaxID=578093 RepID=A0A6A6NQW9_9PEZI|nr:hypothetical protein BDY21DRAFT_400959 [Lineolata rhizophorae]